MLLGLPESELEAAKAALAALESEGAEARLAELNTELTTCPFCGQAATWVTPSASANNNFGNGTHYYIYGTFNRTYGSNVFIAEAAGTSACLRRPAQLLIRMDGKIRLSCLMGMKMGIALKKACIIPEKYVNCF